MLGSLITQRGTYVRLGSTNRGADSQTILSLQMLAKNTSFDELPCIGAVLTDIDDEVIKTYLSPTFGAITKRQYESLGIVTKQHSKQHPTNGVYYCLELIDFNGFLT